MRKTIIASVLLMGSLIALPATAQTTWSGSNLVVTGQTTNGCRIRMVSATHTGSTLNNIMVTLRNGGANTVRVSGDTTLAGNNQRKTGTLALVQLAPNAQATTQAGYPFGGSLAGTTLTVNITACQTVTP